MKVRSFKQSDAKELLVLFFNTIRNVNISDYNQAQVIAWAPDLAEWDIASWERSFQNKFVFVSEENGELLGFGELENDGHIDRFYIHKDHIGQGVGLKLYENIELQAIALKLPKLFVEASITAKPFFQKRGFEIIKEQEVERRGVLLKNFVMHKELFINKEWP